MHTSEIVFMYNKRIHVSATHVSNFREVIQRIKEFNKYTIIGHSRVETCKRIFYIKITLLVYICWHYRYIIYIYIYIYTGNIFIPYTSLQSTSFIDIVPTIIYFR